MYAATEDGIRRRSVPRTHELFRTGQGVGDDVKVGKGKRKTYSIAQIERWLACLELTEFGLSSIAAGELITGHWGCVRTNLPGRAGVGCARPAARRRRWRHPSYERKLGTKIRISRCPEH